MSRTLPRPILGSGRALESMVVIGRAFGEKAFSQESGRAGQRSRNRISLFRQRNELMFLRNSGEVAGFPVLLGLFDPLLAGGDEIPPDVARALQRIAAEKHHPRRPHGLHGDAVAGAEDQEPRTFIAL